MKTDYHRLILTLILCMNGPAACRTIEDAGNATWKHTFGETRAERAIKPDRCTEGSQNPDEQKYIRLIVDHIVASNPKTFYGDLNPSTICVTVSNDDEFNARMNSSNGHMIINRGIFTSDFRFASDAEFAGIIAHELAHYTMAHGFSNAVRTDNLPPGYSVEKEESLRQVMYQKHSDKDRFERKLELEYLTKHKVSLANITEEAIQKFKPYTKYDNEYLPGIKKLKSAAIRISQSGVNPSEADIEDTMMLFDQYFYDTVTRAKHSQKGLLTQKSITKAEALLSDREAIQQKITIMDPPIDAAYDELLTYRLPRDQFDEQQADEVGFELFVRAGFEPNIFAENFANVYEYMIKKGNCDWVTARSKAPGRLRRDKDDRKHPDFCFRYWDLKYAEQRAHREEYQAIARRPGIINLEETAALRKKLGIAPEN